MDTRQGFTGEEEACSEAAVQQATALALLSSFLLQAICLHLHLIVLCSAEHSVMEAKGHSLTYLPP